MEGISEDVLTQPLLDGGQGKKNVLPSVLTKPQGDVNADGSTAKLQTKIQPTQTNWAGGQRPRKANINNLQPYDLIMDRGQQVPTQTQQPITMGAWTTNTKGAPTNIDGLLPPIIEATGNLVAGKDIKKLCLQKKGGDRRYRSSRRQHSLHGWCIREPRCFSQQYHSQSNGEVKCVLWVLHHTIPLGTS
jgi:hypothetical protein